MSDIPRNAKVSRKLAAILAADIASFSTLMGADEGATVRDLNASPGPDPCQMVAKYGGSIIDTSSDGLGVEPDACSRCKRKWPNETHPLKRGRVCNSGSASIRAARA